MPRIVHADIDLLRIQSIPKAKKGLAFIAYQISTRLISWDIDLIMIELSYIVVTGGAFGAHARCNHVASRSCSIEGKSQLTTALRSHLSRRPRQPNGYLPKLTLHERASAPSFHPGAK